MSGQSLLVSLKAMDSSIEHFWSDAGKLVNQYGGVLINDEFWVIEAEWLFQAYHLAGTNKPEFVFLGLQANNKRAFSLLSSSEHCPKFLIEMANAMLEAKQRRQQSRSS
ncbi:hypothetical protein IC617_07585 [Neiella sp. HB171785]|uniref:Uncharacterized protein n=1 Tax=Neiella litorisoli TaxID=2771431 RepID=A0A8J6UPR6_9GAMM|nr:hypothetical protein [Neiella litorisoli]MBD1389282.1 hypothetical protein [Neiella litorisoli]